MHVAIVIGRFPPGVVGGAEIQAETWARRLASRHRVSVVTRHDAPGQSALEERDGFVVHRLPVSPLPGWRTVADVAGIARVVAGLAPRPDVLLCFITFNSGLAGAFAGRRLGIPAVVWIRGDAEYRLGSSRFQRLVAPRVWKAARGVLVQSEANRRQLLAELERFSPGTATEIGAKLAVVPNGLELPAGPFPPGRRVLSVGRLIADKGMDVVIAACARAGLPLTIAGDGPERPGLERLAGEAGADVRFAGFVSRPGLDAFYRDASAAVLASRRGEGMPNVVLEAMSYARPVVVTPSGATSDVIRDGETGLVVGPGDAAALADALRRLHDGPGLAATLGRNARALAESFGWDAVLPRLEAELERWSRP